MEKISVIIPIYNVEKYLRKCLDSVINQTYRNLEIILVNDGSTDNSGKICEEYKKEEERIRLIHKENGGLSSARNCGLDLASGEYIAFLDSDDYMRKDMLEKLYNRLQETQSDLSMCSIQYVDEAGTYLDHDHRFSCPDAVISAEEFWRLYCSEGHTECVVSWNKLYKRKIFKQLYFPVGKVREDEFVLPFIVEKCQKICTLSEKMIFYLQRADSLTGKNNQKMRLDYIEAFFERIDFWKKKRNSLMIEDSMFHLISSVENYHLEYEENYVELKNKIKREIQDPLLQMHSRKGKVIVLLYKYNLFPYRLVHEILIIRQKLQKRV